MIAESIGYAGPEVSFDEIKEAPIAAKIHDDMESMDGGYNAVVGERGKLSGGQKQRIAIASAILWYFPIIILDESTAAVNIETEQHIRSAIA